MSLDKMSYKSFVWDKRKAGNKDEGANKKNMLISRSTNFSKPILRPRLKTDSTREVGYVTDDHDATTQKSKYSVSWK